VRGSGRREFNEVGAVAREQSNKEREEARSKWKKKVDLVMTSH